MAEPFPHLRWGGRAGGAYLLDGDGGNDVAQQARFLRLGSAAQR